MIEITKIEPQKKNKSRYSIYLDDKFAFGIHENILIEHSLSEGMHLSNAFIEDILKSEEKNKALSYALNLLSYRPRSQYEIQVKMNQKGYEPEFIDFAIEKLKKDGYINDKEFALMFARDKLAFNKIGKQRLISELYQKGVDRKIIDEVIQEVIDEDNEYKRALAFALKKIKSYKKDDIYTKKRKLYNSLAGRGFDFSTISKVVADIINKS